MFSRRWCRCGSCGIRSSVMARRPSWLLVALLVGAVYFVIGKAFAIPADHLRFWRWVALLVSVAVFAAHIAYGHFRLRHRASSTAWHTALAVAIGAFLLAAAGVLHALQATSSPVWSLWLLALVAWPVFTAVPAYLVALVASAVLGRLGRRG